MKIKIITSLLFIYCGISTGYSQYENVWIMGDSIGLDFNNGSPIEIQSNMYAHEAAASICDPNGNLLFYTQGDKIWDRNHNLMPNGQDLVPNGLGIGLNPTASTAQGALIVPMPGSEFKRYYVFSLTAISGGNHVSMAGRLYYSVVDMTLNNGLGDVIPSQKGVFLDSNLSEKMISVAGSDCDVWLLVATEPDSISSFVFKAYNISMSGVNSTPTISSPPPYNVPFPIVPPGAGGFIIASPDRKKIATSEYYIDLLRIYDFDPATGILSNTMELPFYGGLMCFSPNNTKLYANDDSYSLVQLDLTSNNPASIMNSLTYLGIKGNPKLQFHNNKVYISTVDGNQGLLSVIHAPNLPGLACQPQANILSLHKRPENLPNVITPAIVTDTVSTIQNITGACATIEENGEKNLHPLINNATYYRWENGDTSAGRTVYEDGIYWVTYIKDCTYHVDSFRVSFSRIKIHTEPGCINEAKGKAWVEKVDPSDTVNYQFTWLNANMDTLINASSLDGVPPGTYYVYVYTDFCEGLFLVEIKAIPDSMQFQNIDPVDTLIPYGASVQITTQSDAIRWAWEPVTYLDNPQSESPVSTPEQAITYQVIGYGPLGCTDTGWVKIRLDYSSNIKVPSAFSPNGDGLNDVFKIYLQQYEKLVTFKVFNRWGNLVFETADINRGWDGSYKGQPATADVYMYYIEVLLPGPDGGKVETIKGDVTLVR